jgi:hypothetical protein
MLTSEQEKVHQPAVGPSLFLKHGVGLPDGGYRPSAATRKNLVFFVEIVSSATEDAKSLPPMGEKPAAAKFTELPRRFGKRSLKDSIARSYVCIKRLATVRTKCCLATSPRSALSTQFHLGRLVQDYLLVPLLGISNTPGTDCDVSSVLGGGAAFST